VPVWFEPVSAVKAERAAGLMHHMTYVSPNAQELTAMAYKPHAGGGRRRGKRMGEEDEVEKIQFAPKLATIAEEKCGPLLY
jgi:hypothetical protein